MAKILGLITARGGSKGLPGKNIKSAFGKPLIAWTIEAAQKSKMIDRLVLSSDDDQIIKIAKKWGCEVPFIRPSKFASDTASSIEVAMHALEKIPGYDYLIILQPTSPLRNEIDIDSSIKLILENHAPTCVSLCESSESPYLMHTIKKNGSIQKILPDMDKAKRRQDLPQTYILNGAIFIANIKWFKEYKTFISEETIGYLMPLDRSIDIDDFEDFERFKAIKSAEL